MVVFLQTGPENEVEGNWNAITANLFLIKRVEP